MKKKILIVVTSHEKFGDLDSKSVQSIDRFDRINRAFMADKTLMEKFNNTLSHDR